MNQMTLTELTALANRIRQHCVRMTGKANASHIGSALSVADILAALYGKALRYDPKRPDWLDRDRFIMSKGHACTALYATLAESGFFPVEALETFYQNGSPLAGHVMHKDNPGVELSTGSLGHGLPVAAGMAIVAKRDGRASRVFCLLSDGECDEGSVWESALFAPQHNLDNLIAIVVSYGSFQWVPTKGRIRLHINNSLRQVVLDTQVSASLKDHVVTAESTFDLRRFLPGRYELALQTGQDGWHTYPLVIGTQ